MIANILIFVEFTYFQMKNNFGYAYCIDIGGRSFVIIRKNFDDIQKYFWKNCDVLNP